ncbi:laminin subunit alpha-5 isoform X1 [Scleropages formosus]|uniref:laminin subunit alpha-5 isoform X1 n=1 Tax=Scleropages formosus TaxID=113540 RepID=UPI0010FA64E5|nr:laminin subunit alpha-5 isoform X1 [Scleropages formosus]
MSRGRGAEDSCSARGRAVPRCSAAWTWMWSSCVWSSCAWLWTWSACAVRAQELPTNGVNGFSLHPPYFNLAEGTKITATATCGEDSGGRPVRDLYCKLVGGPVSGDPGQTIQGQYCDICTMSDSNRAHPITNAIDGTERWWQSPPLSRSAEFNEVNVTLDLGQLFHVAYVLIKFANSPRPDLWVLERSVDFGKNYQPWQFFASSKRDCIERFGWISVERINKDDDVICTTEYSRIVPLENGEIVVSLVNGRPGAMNFSYSPALRDFTKATNIRLRFLRTNTLLGHLMGKALRDPTVTRRYYYSIKDISIGGRCVCNGHAEACNAKDPNDPYRLQCDCQHNTCGASCDQCCPGFNQMPWKPATTDSANECEPCNCNKHALDCYYDPEVEQRRASVDLQGQPRGGGVCLDCQHHTAGVNCERCVPGYYRSPDHPLDSLFACSPCACESEFTDGTCEDLTGRCYCKPSYTGEKCDACAEGYAHFPLCYPAHTHPDSNGEALPAGEIINCECNAAGTEGNSCRPDPRSRTCVCKPGFVGAHCDSCAPGFFGLNCQECQCHGPGCLDGTCDTVTGQCHCRGGFQGYLCDQCSLGYFNYPLCQLCGCSSAGSLPAICDASGRCLCRPEFQGPRCEQCQSGFHSYPSCQECSCDPRGSLGSSCSATGHCHCRPNFSGASCDQCASGYYGFPSCTPCQCSAEGSHSSACDQVTGQCTCLPNVVGQRCDSCRPGSYGFPLCQDGTCNPSGSVQNEVLPTTGSCECRPYVEGAACDKCKPLYWNLSPDTPYGCSSCECNTDGTLSGVAECVQTTGQCHCKANVCSGTCAVCKDGYFNLHGDNYFGCQGCQCDIGGSAGLSCGERNGRCRCRPNVEGQKCNQPRTDHYFPDLHHLKFEIEDGTTVDGRPVRFGYNHLEFGDFSWRGYAQMSSVQPKVVVSVSISTPDLFHMVLRFVNRGSTDVHGRISVLEDGKNFLCGNCSDQSKQIIFAPTSDPTFVNVPQNSFVQPFVLNPGTWTVVIEAEGVLLDYLVLLPSAYYEAPILQIRVTEPCMYSPPEDASQNCLLYKYLSLDGFPTISGNDASCRSNNHLPRPCHTEKVTPRHPTMAVCRGSDISIQLRTPPVPPADYAIVMEYLSEEESPQRLTVSVNMPGRRTHQAFFTLLYCKYSFLCRVVSVDDNSRVAFFSLSSAAEVQLLAERTSFFLHKVFLIPREQFTMEYLEPGVHCISTHGSFSSDSTACIPSRFQTPSQSLLLKEGQASSVQDSALGAAPQPSVTTAHSAQRMPHVGPLAAADNGEHIRLDSSQNAVVFSARVHTLGRYVFILHYHQPLHPTFVLQVFLNGGRVWQGYANATFCPHGYGCRSLIISENQIILDVTDHEILLTIQAHGGRMLWLDYVLVVPEDRYSSNYLAEEPLDKSYDFISNCGQNSFYIHPTSSSQFCRTSAASLSAFFNNGALPCACHEVGAYSDACEAFGGQCRCLPHVIGRDCSQCATGYWGFPNCRPCECGIRLCEPVTGECICPPRTVRPDCVQCEPQTFGCHPLVGCEVCNCSRPGVTAQDISCDTDSGQCRCKNNIVGRRCDRCAPGFYGYPNCRLCDCNEAGTESDICDARTGRCLCKENVEGAQCDQCRVGTFHLDPTNPKGCTSCFCFGATDRCRSSEKRWTEFMDMRGWTLLGGDRQEVPVSTDVDKSLVEADLRDVPDVYQDLHWHAPHSYLGDKVSSYGGYLRYYQHSQTQPTRGDMLELPPEASRPDVILKGNQMTLVYMEREYSSPGMPHEGIVHLVEGSFRHSQTGNPVSREELMMVLVALEALQIRALHSQSSLAVTLRRVVLESASQSSTGKPASNVEMCLCPANYKGDSCQQCAPGYYRDTKGLFLGKCVPCNCNGHSDQCLDGSGICVNCQHNTAGDHCEKCQGGFLDNGSLDGHAVSCSSCPCPLQVTSNNFAVRCVEKPNHMQCLCMPGYAGPKCERCAPGFYGNPMVIGSTCQPCQCHDNTDPNMLFSDCHPLTGVCQGCMHNTTGPYCEVCAPGFYGDAITAKNCTRCNCSPCGTASCDPRSGECHCKPGVTGARCDHCETGSFGFETCGGCQRCNCDAAAALIHSCDPRNGTCACQPGVNGPHCRQCAPGYWGYSPNGCMKCECKTGLCDPRTGECTCSKGLTGKQCDTCVDRYSVLVEIGEGSIYCQPCDSCVIVLLKDLENMNNRFLADTSQITNLNASSIAWAQLRNISQSINATADALEVFNRSLELSKNRADMVEIEAQSIGSDTDELEEKATVSRKKAEELKDSTNRTHQRAEDLLTDVRRIVGEVEDIAKQANRTSVNETNKGTVEDLSEKLSQVEEMLRDMRFKGFQHQKDVADTELATAQKLLERVKEELVSRLADNQALVQKIRDRLGKFHAELMDLRDALNQAVNNTARAAETNNINAKRLEENLQNAEGVQNKKKEVDDLLQMAVDIVTQVNDLLSMLQDSKEECEHLAAQLDGARLRLAEKVQRFASATSKIALVEKAEEHAEMLNQLAKNLSSVISDTNQDGFIQRAVNASRAYSNIIEAIQKAENAAHEAYDASMVALENVQGQDLGTLSKGMKNRSIELEKEAVKLQDSLTKDLKPQLQKARTRLKEAKNKQASLLKDLQMINMSLNFSREETAKDIADAKQAAEKANATATQVEDMLSPMKKQLDEWQKQYGNSNATGEDISKAFLEANKSVGMLGETIPLLIKKLDKLQNHSMQMPNISENIERIRELIAQARRAASKVNVPVKFNGTAGVQVRNPQNLADLAAYTSLKLYITLPESSRKTHQADTPSQFVFYLGNKNANKEFLGMMLEGKKLRWVYNLGADTAEVMVDQDILSDGSFNSVSVERTLQYGQMAITSEGLVKTVTKADVEAGGDLGLLNLPTEETVFYVGGYPDSFDPPPQLKLPGFQGCIELDTLNEEVLSLYNFERTFQLNTTEVKPCGRTKPVLTQPWVNDGAYFDGTGYAEIAFGEGQRRFEQEARVLSHNGILLLFLDKDRFLCLAVRQGMLKLYWKFNGEMVEEQPSDPTSEHLKISDAEVRSVELIILQRSGVPQQVLVRSNRFILFRKSYNQTIPSFSGSYFLGGVPADRLPDSLKPLFPDKGSIKGCFRNIKAHSSHIDLKVMNTSGVSYGCSPDLLVAREAHFTGQSYLNLRLEDLPDLQSNFYTGFGFHTEQRNGLMFHHQAQDGVCQVYLDKGHIVARSGKNQVKTQKTYNDANRHYVALYSNNKGVRLYIDDMLEKGTDSSAADSNNAGLQAGSVYLGGTPEALNLSNLTGCISNLFVRRINKPEQMVVNLLKSSENINVPLSCPAAKGPQQILALPRTHKPPKGRRGKPLTDMKSRTARESCQPQMASKERGALQFSGSSHSYLRFNVLPEVFRKTPHFSMAVRVKSSEGLIFYASGEKGAAIVLLVSNGRFLLLINSGHRKTSIHSHKKYNDGQWHTVFVKRERDNVSLIVDGINRQSRRLSKREKSRLSRLSPPLYIGGLPVGPPSSANMVLGPGGFVGCIRDVKLNEEPLQTPSHSLGVVPCFREDLQPGVYFSNLGGHLSIDDTLVVSRNLEIKLEIRPISDSGLLLHAGGTTESQLTLYLSQGEVTVMVNNGNGEFSVSVSPEDSLCNGRWHNITIVKKGSEVQLNVDESSEHAAGPPQSRSSGVRQALYLGGVPDTVDVPGLPSSLPLFHGCIRRAVINQRLVMLSKPLSLQGSVSTHGCPAL